MKKIIISGISGFIGTKLANSLISKGYYVQGLYRKDFELGIQNIQNITADADFIINLAGSPINKRWTKKYKQILYNSRIENTRMIVDAIKENSKKPEMFISVSAVGIYDEKGQKDEDSKIIDGGFLTNLCLKWEQEAILAEPYVDTCICRLGVALDKEGGAFTKMLLPFKMGLGGKIGTGNQILSWIHIDDLLAAFHFIIENKCFGIFNFTSPYPIKNKEFVIKAAKKLNSFSFFAVPAFLLRLIFGRAAVVLTHGQYVIPKKLLNSGFVFKYPHIDDVFNDLL